MRLSARTAWSRTPNALAEAVTSRRARGLRTLDLTASNPTAAFERLGHEDILARPAAPEAQRYRPDPMGMALARDAVARYYADHGARVDPAHVVLTASSSEAYGWLFKLLCDPGDRALVTRPGYPLFDELARLEGVSLDAVPLLRDAHWAVDLDALDHALRRGARALCLVHPNNPTGHFVRSHERDALVARCARHGLALVVDEVFLDHPWRRDLPHARTFAATSDVLTFTLSGLSKVCAAPQVKLGWIVVSGPPALRDEALARLELIADCYLSVSAAAQLLAPELLAARARPQATIAARLDANLTALRGALRGGSALTPGPSEGGWYASLRLPATRDEAAWSIALLDRGALAQPGWFYDFPEEPWMVLSLLTPPAEFLDGLAALAALVDEG